MLDLRAHGAAAGEGSQRPEGALGKASQNWKNNVMLICSISLEGMSASMRIEGAADREAFLHYIEPFLCPALKLG